MRLRNFRQSTLAIRIYRQDPHNKQSIYPDLQSINLCFPKLLGIKTRNKAGFNVELFSTIRLKLMLLRLIFIFYIFYINIHENKVSHTRVNRKTDRDSSLSYDYIVLVTLSAGLRYHPKIAHLLHRFTFSDVHKDAYLSN